MQIRVNNCVPILDKRKRESACVLRLFDQVLNRRNDTTMKNGSFKIFLDLLLLIVSHSGVETESDCPVTEHLKCHN